MREIAVSLIPKEQLDYLKGDEKYIEFIKNELTKKISDRIIQVLEICDDIIIKKPVLQVSDCPPLHSVEYRKTVDWKPIVKCKDCIHNEGSDNEPWCRIYECRKSKNGFCDEGRKNENVEIH